MKIIKELSSRSGINNNIKKLRPTDTIPKEHQTSTSRTTKHPKPTKFLEGFETVRITTNNRSENPQPERKRPEQTMQAKIHITV